MRDAIELATVWPKSRKRTQRSLEDIGIAVTAPADCPFTFEELFSEDFDLDRALGKLAAASEPRRDVP